MEAFPWNFYHESPFGCFNFDASDGRRLISPHPARPRRMPHHSTSVRVPVLPGKKATCRSLLGTPLALPFHGQTNLFPGDRCTRTVDWTSQAVKVCPCEPLLKVGPTGTTTPRHFCRRLARWPGRP